MPKNLLKRSLMISLMIGSILITFSCGGGFSNRQVGSDTMMQAPTMPSQTKTYSIGFDQVWQNVVNLIQKNEFTFSNDNGIISIYIDYLSCQSLQDGQKACGYQKNMVQQTIALSQIDDGHTRIAYRTSFKKKIINQSNSIDATRQTAEAILGKAFFHRLDAMLAEKGFTAMDLSGQDNEETLSRENIRIDANSKNNMELLSSGKYKVISVSHGNIRELPSPKGKIVAVKQAGDQLKILDKKGNWYLILLENGRQGWAYKSLFGSDAD